MQETLMTDEREVVRYLNTIQHPKRYPCPICKKSTDYSVLQSHGQVCPDCAPAFYGVAN